MKKLQALLDQDLNVEDEETFQPSPVADRQTEQEVLPLVAWHFSAEDCNYLDPQHAAKDFDSADRVDCVQRGGESGAGGRVC